MIDFEMYTKIELGEVKIPSILYAILPAGQEPPSITEIFNTLKKSNLKILSMIPSPGDSGLAGHWKINVQIDWQDETKTEYILWLEHKVNLGEFHIQRIGFSEEEKRDSFESNWVVAISTVFGKKILVDFHRQLKLLNVLSLEPPSVLDVAACTLHPGSWIKDAAEAKTPTSPENLFTIHSVRADEKNDDKVWLHTHGLLRCRLVEMEMIGVEPGKVEVLEQLLKIIAMTTIEAELPPTDVVFEPIKGVYLVWLPFELAILKFKSNIVGGSGDRDEYHSYPSAVFFERKKRFFVKTYKTPNNVNSIIEENPLIPVSNEETQRMSKLAIKRFPIFRSYFQQYSGKEKWLF